MLNKELNFSSCSPSVNINICSIEINWDGKKLKYDMTVVLMINVYNIVTV